MNLLVATAMFVLVLGGVHGYTNIGPCANHALDGQSCSFHYNDRESTCTTDTFSLSYDNCQRECDLTCDLHPPRHPHCENAAYLASCSYARRGYCQKDCGISTYVTSYKNCPNFPGWLSCPDYCCCDTCGGPPVLPEQQQDCPYYTRHFPKFGTCENRKGSDNDQVCPPMRCRDDMHYLVERCVCVTKSVFTSRNWDSANDYCRTTYPGGHLMMMRYRSEFDFLATHYSGYLRLWVGFRREAPSHPTFRYYPDNREVTADLWNSATNQPDNWNDNEECGEAWNGFWNNYHDWNDAPCGQNRQFVCEMEPYV